MSKTEDSLAVFWWEGDGHEERDGIYLYGLWRAEEIRAPRAPFPFELEPGTRLNGADLTILSQMNTGA